MTTKGRKRTAKHRPKLVITNIQLTEGDLLMMKILNILSNSKVSEIENEDFDESYYKYRLH